MKLLRFILYRAGLDRGGSTVRHGHLARSILIFQRPAVRGNLVRHRAARDRHIRSRKTAKTRDHFGCVRACGCVVVYLEAEQRSTRGNRT